MSADPKDVREVARFLRQREDFGVREIFLEGLTRTEALHAADEARRGASPAIVDRDGASSAGAVRSSHRKKPIREPESGAGRADLGHDRGVEISGPEVDLADLKYTDLKAVAESCERCRLAKGRTQVVFSDGNPQARLMVVGEAPGANEDRTGLPFVGQAGKFLDLLLAAVDLSRKDSVYICNVLKCRPPGNRDPMPDEIEHCSPFLKRQIALVAPEVILAVGTFAAQLLTGSNQPLGKLRGSVYAYQGVPLVVTYHPAALLRNAGWTRSTWDDLQLLRQVMDGSE